MARRHEKALGLLAFFGNRDACGPTAAVMDPGKSLDEMG